MYIQTKPGDEWISKSRGVSEKGQSHHLSYHGKQQATCFCVTCKLLAYPDLDAWSSGSAQPVAVGAEAEGIDDVTPIQSVEVFAFIQVPQHGLAILEGEK